MTGPEGIRVRREPPKYRPVVVVRTEEITPRMTRVLVSGGGVAEMATAQPAASVRLLIPSEPGGPLVMPEWNGNEFLLADGSRPLIRTLTPVSGDASNDTLELHIVTSHPGALSNWASSALPGAPAAVSGPGRGWELPGGFDEFVVAGDETALPAIAQVLDVLPRAAGARVVVEIGAPDGRLGLGRDPEWVVTESGAFPGEALADRMIEIVTGTNAYVWAAGEAASMQRIRNHLFKTMGMQRGSATVRGYWKRERR